MMRLAKKNPLGTKGQASRWGFPTVSPNEDDPEIRNGQTIPPQEFLGKWIAGFFGGATRWDHGWRSEPDPNPWQNVWPALLVELVEPSLCTGCISILVTALGVCYPLVNVYITNWKDPPCYWWVVINYFDWAIFTSYVSHYQRVFVPHSSVGPLPTGRLSLHWCRVKSNCFAAQTPSLVRSSIWVCLKMLGSYSQW